MFPVAIPAAGGLFLGPSAAQMGVKKRSNSHLSAFATGAVEEGKEIRAFTRVGELNQRELSCRLSSLISCLVPQVGKYIVDVG